MNEYEKYLFDLNGYLLLEDVLSPEEVAACNEAIDHNLGRLEQREIRSAKWSDSLKGKGRRDLRGMLTWPKPWCLSFRDLLSHPRILDCMLELLDDGFRVDTIYGIVMDKGTEGLALHGGGIRRNNLINFYEFLNGRMCCGLTVVSWALTDCGSGDGGFMCIPGSHKASYPLPGDAMTMETDLGVVKQVPMKAGSVVIFTEALAHGTLPWTADHERRSVLFKYSPGPLTHAPSDSAFSDTCDYLPRGIKDVWDELTPQQQAMLEPPYYPKRPSIRLANTTQG